jgi:hypothetical protein
MDEAEISAAAARVLDLLDTGHCRWTRGTAGPCWTDVPGTERCAIGLLACALDVDLKYAYLPPERALPAYDRLAEILTAMHPVARAPSGFQACWDTPPVSVGQITTVNDTAASADDIRAAFEKMRAG